MAERKKIDEKLDDAEYIKKITDDYLETKETISLAFFKDGPPENYVRERYTSRGGRFYNKKGGLMKKDQQLYVKQIPAHLKSRLTKLVVNKTAEYYIDIDINFYVAIQKNESIKKSVLKEKQIILPAIRPDIDNYLKFTIDSLHNVLFDDDKRIVFVNSHKFYSLKPRTEILAKITIIKD